MSAKKPTSVRMSSELRKQVAAEAKVSAQSQQAVLLSAIRAGLPSLLKQRRKP